jgi:hypothetical protein
MYVTGRPFPAPLSNRDVQVDGAPLTPPEQLLRFRTEVRGDPRATRRYVLRTQDVEEPDPNRLDTLPRRRP